MRAFSWRFERSNRLEPSAALSTMKGPKFSTSKIHSAWALPSSAIQWAPTVRLMPRPSSAPVP